MKVLLLQLVAEVVIQVEAIQPSIVGNKLVPELHGMPEEVLPILVVLSKSFFILKLLECRECWIIIVFNGFLRCLVLIIPRLLEILMDTLSVGHNI